MVLSLFCGVTPAASAAEHGNENGIITIDCEPAYSDLNRTSMRVEVKMATSFDTLESFEVDSIRKNTADTVTISINQDYLAKYEISSIEINSGKGYTGWDNAGNTAQWKQITFSTGVGENPTLTVYLSEAQNVLPLTDSTGTVNMGTIAYRPGNQTTTVEVYLNYELINTYSDIGIFDGTNNFILDLQDGYYFGQNVNGGVAIDNAFDFESTNGSQSITWPSPYTTMDYTITNGIDNGIRNTVQLYFFDYNDGVNVDFNRKVNGNLGYLDPDAACPSLEIQFENEDYAYTYDAWQLHNSIYAPRNTTVYVTPQIGDGYGFNSWTCHDAHVDNTLYTIDANGQLRVEAGLVSDGLVAVSENMAFKYSADTAYRSGTIYLNLTYDDQFWYDYYTVSYDANADDATGSVAPQTFDDYYVYVRNNGFTREGYTFTGWNTEPDGSGTAYQPNDIYGDADGEQRDITLYAQWEKTSTEPEKPQPPNPDQLDDLLDGKIIVDCITLSSHADGIYGLVSGCYTLPADGVTGSAADGWKYVITIDASAYAEHYQSQTGYGVHTAEDTIDPQITLTYDTTSQSWQEPDALTLKVNCLGQAGPYRLTYDGNAQENGAVSGLPSPNPVTGLNNGTYPLSKQVPTHTDVNSTRVLFVGWSTTAVSEILDKDDPDPTVVPSVEIAGEDEIVYAVWGYDKNNDGKPDVTEDTYTLTFHANGGTFEDSTDTNPVTGLLADTYPLDDTLSGYEAPTHADVTLEDGTAVAVKLVGWATAQPGKAIYEAGDTDVPATVSEITLADDNEVWAVWGYDEDGDGTADVNQIVITPADIVIYTGGDGYEGGIVDEDGNPVSGDDSGESDNGNGFPEPGFYITLPKALNDKLQAGHEGPVNLSNQLYFVYEQDASDTSRRWNLALYNPDTDTENNIAYEKFVYQLVPGESQAPVRLLITDETGEEVPSDQFTFALDTLYKAYTMTIYGGDSVETNAVQAVIGGEPYSVYVDTGDLVVRGVSNAGSTSPVTSQAPDTISGITAVADDVTYHINDSEIPVREDAEIHLLTDDLATDAATASLLENAVNRALAAEGLSTQNLTYVFKYLDLVDTTNGNAYVTLADNNTVTIYWEIPENAEDVYVIHLDGLDRNFEANELAGLLIDPTKVQANVYHTGSTDNLLTVETGGVSFSTSTFSPFVVAYVDSTPAQTYTVTYNLNGGTGTTPSSQTVTAGTSITVANSSGFYRSNHTFTGWNTASNGTGTGYAANSSMVVSSSVTLYAQWSYNGGSSTEDDEHLLKFESNGGTEFDDVGPYDHSFTVDLDDYIPTRPGYVFTGWYRQRNLTSRVSGNFTVPGVVTLFAGWEESSVPSMLNGDDHFAYIQGYADGTVRPNANITRAQVATIFFRLLDPEVRDDYLTTTNSFPDVNEDYWANTAISTMAALGVINGRNSGLFDPDAPITRAEFAAICSRFDESNITGVDTFTDISGHWAEEEIQRAAALGWVQGYSDGTFHPNANITRAQAVTMINRVLCRLPEDTEDLLPGMNVWTDCDEDDWYYLAIQEATNSHDYETKDRVYESWTDLNSDPDWSQYE